MNSNVCIICLDNISIIWPLIELIAIDDTNLDDGSTAIWLIYTILILFKPNKIMRPICVSYVCVDFFFIRDAVIH